MAHISSRKLLQIAVVIAVSATPVYSIACMPPPGQPFNLPTPEQEADLFLKSSDAIYIGYMVSRSPVPSPGKAENVGVFRISAVLRGKVQTRLGFEEHMCSTPFSSPGSQPDENQPLLLMVMGDRLLRAYDESSPQSRSIQKSLAEPAGKTESKQ